MRKNGLIPVVVLLMGMGVLVCGAAELKMAVVDMSRLIQAHPDTGEAEDLLEKQAAEFDKERSEILSEFEQKKSAFEAARDLASSKALSEAGREAKMEEARGMLDGLQLMEREIRETAMRRQKQLGDQKERMGRRIVKKITDVLKEYAEKNGYKLILDSSCRGLSGVESLLYFDTALDVTDDVLKRGEFADSPAQAPAQAPSGGGAE